MFHVGNSAPALWAVRGVKHGSIKGSKVQAPVNTPDESVSCFWIFRKQKKLNEMNALFTVIISLGTVSYRQAPI